LRIAARDKIYKEDNKEKIKKYRELHKEDAKKYKEENKVSIAAEKTKYNATPQGKRLTRINRWKCKGVKGDLEDIYDNFYINEKYCWVCQKDFKDSFDRCMDHNHSNGLFRQILCQKCNRNDHWMKVKSSDI
jgi:hypothetical protein